MKIPEQYKGWKISYHANAPTTGKVRAERFGVGMCANDWSLLKRMIDTRIEKVALLMEG